MSALEKLKSRTEWQAFLVMLVATFSSFFFGIDMEAEQFERLFDMLGLAWGGTASYAVSRGIGKAGKGVGVAPEPAQPGAASEADSSQEE